LRTVFLVALLAAVLAFPSGVAAAPFAIGSGSEPGLAVDGAGTAYIAYNGAEAANPPHFCRLPRGATACDVERTLFVSPGSATLSRPTVTVVGARVTVVVHRTGGQQPGITRYTSADGGFTFSAPVLVGGNVPNVESVNGPGDTVSVVSQVESAGALFQNVSLTSGTPAGSVATLFPSPRLYNGTVGLIDANTPLAIFSDLSFQGAFRRYAGTGDINNQANWTAPVDIGYVDYPRLAGGPSGLFLISGDESFGLFVRKWDGVSFGPRATLTTNGDDSEMHLSQDAGGRLHAVYASNQADGYHAVYALSDDGVNWQSATVALQISDEPAAMRVAAAADHVGVAVWDSSVVNEIRVTAIGPLSAPPPPPPPAPTPTPVAVADPVPQFHKTVVVKPISGKVRVRLKGAKTFTDLGSIDDIPLGATIDVKKGRIELASVPSRAGAVEKIQLYGGWFRVGQPAALTEFSLNEPLASCKKKAHAAAAKPKSRKLWGDGKGKFRTRGQYSAATIRGTRFLVQDSCVGTLTRVTQGSVLVRDNVKRKNIVLRAGKRYTARPRR
jgi:hypothetical protein